MKKKPLKKKVIIKKAKPSAKVRRVVKALRPALKAMRKPRAKKHEAEQFPLPLEEGTIIHINGKKAVMKDGVAVMQEPATVANVAVEVAVQETKTTTQAPAPTPENTPEEKMHLDLLRATGLIREGLTILSAMPIALFKEMIPTPTRSRGRGRVLADTSEVDKQLVQEEKRKLEVNAKPFTPDTGDKITAEGLRADLVEFARMNGTEAARELVASFAPRVSDIPEADYLKVKEAMKNYNAGKVE